MSLDQNVIPGIVAALQSLVAGPSSGQATQAGVLTSVHVGEQFRVAGRGPVAWVMGASINEPEPGGSSLEKTDWGVEVRVLYMYTNDQRHAEDVLIAMIEPIRQAFRSHRKLIWSVAPGTMLPVNYPNSNITRARVGSGRFMYTLIDGKLYRMLTLNVLVGEKVGVSYSVGG